MEQERSPGVRQETDEERFARIWRRVMPQDRPDCPFTLCEEAPDTARRLMPNAGDRPNQAAVPAFAPAPPAPAPVRGAPAAPAGEEGGVTMGVFLQGRITVELTAAHTYRSMARQVGGTAAQTLAAMAADKTRNAKRLSVAYFLLSGVRLQVAPPAGGPKGTLVGNLRQCFLGEQASENAYRAAAEQTDDVGLREIFDELGADNAAHAGLLRGILERL